MQKVLITGGSGMIGKRLSQMLSQNGYEVLILSRYTEKIKGVKAFKWDTGKGFIEADAIQEADHIIHLAGAGIADRPWTANRKELLYNSRIKSAELLYQKVIQLNSQIITFTGFSASGYYGDRGEEICKEDDSPGDDFLANLCKDWEEAEKRFDTLNIRTIIFRAGMVLSRSGGALPLLSFPINFYLNPVFGTGKQFLPWIHIDDICAMILRGIENKGMRGIYNAVAPHEMRLEEFLKTLARIRRRKAIRFHLPAILIKMVLGELSHIFLFSQRLSSEKIASAGYNFLYPELKSALININDF